MKRIFLLAVLAILTHTSLPAQVKEVTIPGSRLENLNSSIVNQEYVLHISLPSGYDGKKKYYPVVYLLDSQWDFPLVTAIYGEQYYDGFIPEMIVVGITWGGKNPKPDSLRARDFVPTHNASIPQSGGAEKFLSFIKQELIPYVERNYRADKNHRALMGCSFGGLFTLYALFTEPQLFRYYVAASPAFGWDHEAIYQFEKNYFEKKSTAPARLYMTMGEVERGVPGFKKLVDHLNSRNYKSLSIQSRVLENTGHSGTKAEGFARGLQYAFERPSVQLTSSQIKTLSGKYIAGGNELEITTENNRPVLMFGSNNKFPLLAANANELYSTSEFLTLRFKTDDEGNVTGVEVERFGGSSFFSKSK